MDTEKHYEETTADSAPTSAWTYVQKTGALLRNDQPVATGYSGFDNGKNNPDMQAVPNVGPIPQGTWTIVGPPFNSPEHGPYVMRLVPDKNTHTFGRSGFLMHGDSIEAPGCGSRGCIVMPRTIRELVWQVARPRSKSSPSSRQETYRRKIAPIYEMIPQEKTSPKLPVRSRCSSA